MWQFGGGSGLGDELYFSVAGEEFIFAVVIVIGGVGKCRSVEACVRSSIALMCVDLRPILLRPNPPRDGMENERFIEGLHQDSYRHIKK